MPELNTIVGEGEALGLTGGVADGIPVATDAELTDAFNESTDFMEFGFTRTRVSEVFGGTGVTTGTIGTHGWVVSNSGAGSGLSHPFSIGGARQISTGTTTTGYTMLSFGPSYHVGAPLVGEWRWRVTFSANLSTVSEEYIVYVGLLQGVTAAPAYGVYVVYDRLTYGTNFRGVVQNGSGSTVVDLGFGPEASGFYDLGVQSTGTAIQFTNAGVAVGSAVTTNFPSGVETYGPGWAIRKTAGTTARWVQPSRFAMDLAA